MAMRSIAVYPEVHDMLRSLKVRGQSFSELIRDLVLFKRPEMAHMTFSRKGKAKRGTAHLPDDQKPLAPNAAQRREEIKARRRQYMREYRAALKDDAQLIDK